MRFLLKTTCYIRIIEHVNIELKKKFNVNIRLGVYENTFKETQFVYGLNGILIKTINKLIIIDYNKDTIFYVIAIITIFYNFTSWCGLIKLNGELLDQEDLGEFINKSYELLKNKSNCCIETQNEEDRVYFMSSIFYIISPDHTDDYFLVKALENVKK